MSSSLPPPVSRGVSWLRVSIVPQTVCILGAGAWYSHWDVGARRSVRCGGIACDYCGRGIVATVRYVLLVHSEYDNCECWLELRSRHYDDLCALEERWGTLAGCVLSVAKTGLAENSPVTLEFVSFNSDIVERDISAFVASLGAEPALSSRRNGAAKGTRTAR